jgi:ATP-binding cassette subfamily B protein
LSKILITFWNFLNLKEKVKFFVFLFLMILSSVSELITIASFFPFISQVLDENFYKNENFLKFQELLFNYKLEVFDGNKNLIFNFFLFFIFFVIINTLLRIFITRFNLNFIKNLGIKLASSVFKRLLYKNYESLLDKSSSKIFSIFVNKNDSTIFFVLNFFNLLTYGTLSLSIIISLLYLNFKITIITLVIFISLYLFIILFVRNNIKEISKRTSDAFAERIQSIQKSLIHVRQMLLTNTQEFYINNLLKSEKKIRQGEKDIALLNTFPRIFFEMLAMIIIVSLIFISIFYLFIDKNYILGSLAVVALASQRLLISLNNIYVSWVNITSAIYQSSEIADLLNERLFQINSKKKIIKFNKKITFKNVSFKYRNSNYNVLDKINISIEKGSIVGIVGKTGSGKTTFLDLFCGLLKPQNGKIIYDDNNLFKNLYSWQKQIAYVPQNIYLSDTSILENIIVDDVAKNKVNSVLLDKAARISELNQFITKIPGGFNACIGDGGVRLSGGQCQRIGIARAIYKSSEILLLDESTSAIDYETEDSILKKIIAEYKMKTILIISHRPNSLKHCDKIIVFKDKKAFSFESYKAYIAFFKKKSSLRN